MLFRSLVTPGFAVGQDKLLMTLNYLPDLSAADLAEAHREFGRTHARLIAAPPAPHINTREPERRLRVGYMSPDFRHHSCAFFAAPLLRAHDRDRVEVFAYAEIGAPDAMTAKIKADVDHWRETTRKSDDDVAATVRADRIDILVDLAGHTTGNRLGVFLRKPAPVQATWLGYPATTGVAAIDYRLTDAIADPEGADAFATEQLVRLPSGFLCYEPPADMPAVTPLPARKRGHVTFGCFNNALKINAATVARWAEIMRAVPNARLLVKGFHTDGGLSRGRLNDLLTGQGIAPERFDLRAASPTPQEHFAAYGEVDVALDTAPYNGTATTCEAMWSGAMLWITLVQPRVSKAQSVAAVAPSVA